MVTTDLLRLTEEDANRVTKSILMSLRAAPGEDASTETVVNAVDAGVQVVEDLLKADKGKLDVIVDIFSKAGTVFTAGNAIFTAFTTIKGIIDKSQFDQLIERLDKIITQLTKVEQTVRQGFNDLIAHDDFRDFRKDIIVPTQQLFDRWTRCTTNLDEVAIEEFKKDCQHKDLNPAHILSALYAFLKDQQNIFMTQFAANDYLFSVYTKWRDTVFHTSIQLMAIDLFYYGLTMNDKSEDERKRFSESEVKNLVDQFKRLSERLDEIELDRLSFFHKKGFAAKYLKIEFEKVKEAEPGRDDGPRMWVWPEQYMYNMVVKMRDSWNDFNGPHNFDIMMTRGRYVDNESEITECQAKWFIGDDTKVTAVPNVAFEKKGWGGAGHNGISLCLIQPFTEEMKKKHHDNSLYDYQVVNLMKEKFTHDARDFHLSKIQDPLIKMCPKTPLLIFFNTAQTGTIKEPFEARAAKDFGYMFADRGRGYPDSRQYDMAMKMGFVGIQESTSDCRVLITIFY